MLMLMHLWLYVRNSLSTSIWHRFSRGSYTFHFIAVGYMFRGDAIHLRPRGKYHAPLPSHTHTPPSHPLPFETHPKCVIMNTSYPAFSPSDRIISRLISSVVQLIPRLIIVIYVNSFNTMRSLCEDCRAIGQQTADNETRGCLNVPAMHDRIDRIKRFKSTTT